MKKNPTPKSSHKRKSSKSRETTKKSFIKMIRNLAKSTLPENLNSNISSLESSSSIIISDFNPIKFSKKMSGQMNPDLKQYVKEFRKKVNYIKTSKIDR